MPNNLETEDVLIIGAGPMAVAYGKVLNAQNVNYVTIGRGIDSAKIFEEECKKKVIVGGLKKFVAEYNSDVKPRRAIVAIPPESLHDACLQLMEFGVRNILVEKPGGLNEEQISVLSKKATATHTKIIVGYNRRFLASILKAKEIIEEDGGVSSFNFEFTEWGHVIEKLIKPKEVLDNWFLANSTHVVDLAFYLGGNPKKIYSLTSGGLSWHPDASNFAGCGHTENGALFNYQANWNAPGRWVIEVLTSKHRLLFKPLEKLQIQKKGSVAVEQVDIQDELDIKYKPGLYVQTANFLSEEFSDMIDIHSHHIRVKNTYQLMSGKVK